MKAIHSYYSTKKTGIVKIFILLILTFIITTSCDLTDPKKDKPKPEGYQEDIPWPSLADSPWPMNNHDPQNTGRSKFQGPKYGILEKVISAPEPYSGLVFGKDSTIYLTSSNWYKGLLAYTIEGKLKWSCVEGGESYASPIITKDGSVCYLGSAAVVSIKDDGSVNWIYRLSKRQTSKLFSLDPNGNIFFLDSPMHSLKAVDKNGNLVWEMYNDYFDYILNLSLGNNLAFSPDGNTIYLYGAKSALTSIDINNKIIKWEFGKTASSQLNGSVLGVLVDSRGNIYFPYRSDDNEIYFTSISPEMKQRWKYKLNRSIDEQPTIDKNGTVYFATDTLFAIDYNGKVRWKKFLGQYLTSSLVCDIDGNIYVSLNQYQLNTMSFDNNGNLRWSLTSEYQGVLNSSPALFNSRIFLSANNGYNFYIIK